MFIWLQLIGYRFSLSDLHRTWPPARGYLKFTLNKWIQRILGLNAGTDVVKVCKRNI